jgi:AraC family transcriptional regulator of adaptative response / DNA-3-methyladenine glycosylase II
MCHRAVDARDARFDGLFFVGVTTTRVYCRPVCPSRAARREHRRFFDSAASAEGAGFRPCRRCRPELAQARALVDAVPRLAHLAALRIASGALNGRSVAELASELGVSERHLRRALEREIGVSPLGLAQTHRLFLAKRLLAETTLPVARIAFASGFQSLRRFNSAFRVRYLLSPRDLRRDARGGPRPAAAAAAHDLLHLTLAYRAPFAWNALVATLGCHALPEVEAVEGTQYGRTVRLEGRCGVVLATDVAARAHLAVGVSAALLPVLIPLLARLRQVFDLDAEPMVVDAHLAQGGLAALVRRRPGLRLPGALDGFEGALRVLLPKRPAAAFIAALGEGIDSGIPGLTRLVPSAERVAEAGVARLARLGVPRRRAEVIVTVARAVATNVLRLEPSSDIGTARRALLGVVGVGDRLATAIVTRALSWPDAFLPDGRALQRAAGVATTERLAARAERWRPWRAYAALHLWLEAGEFGRLIRARGPASVALGSDHVFRQD